MRILFLHGLESKVGCEKVEWLRDQGHVVLNPEMKYHDDDCFELTLRAAKMFKPEVIVGSSMGGYFAWQMGKLMSVPVCLLNPALFQKSMYPNIPYKYAEKITVIANKAGGSKVFMMLGYNDDICNAHETFQKMFQVDPYDYNPNNVYWHGRGHRTPVDVFARWFGRIEEGVIQNQKLEMLP
jgi:hypothetical protein